MKVPKLPRQLLEQMGEDTSGYSNESHPQKSKRFGQLSRKDRRKVEREGKRTTRSLQHRAQVVGSRISKENDAASSDEGEPETWEAEQEKSPRRNAVNQPKSILRKTKQQFAPVPDITKSDPGVVEKRTSR